MKIEVLSENNFTRLNKRAWFGLVLGERAGVKRGGLNRDNRDGRSSLREASCAHQHADEFLLLLNVDIQVFHLSLRPRLETLQLRHLCTHTAHNQHTHAIDTRLTHE